MLEHESFYNMRCLVMFITGVCLFVTFTQIEMAEQLVSIRLEETEPINEIIIHWTL